MKNSKKVLFKTNVNNKESCLFQRQTNKGQIDSSKFLNSIKL